MDIDRLDAQFALGDTLRVQPGNGGLPVVAIDNRRASALVSLYGGQVLGYRPSGQEQDLLFVSRQAVYRPGKAIRGGVPLCWPWFGPHPVDPARPAHGLARTRHWQLRDTGHDSDGATRLTLGLGDDADTRALWPHAFDLTLVITVGDSLSLALTTRNDDTRPVTISQALHSYFAVGDIARARVLGLDGCRYLDKAAGGSALQAGAVTIDCEVDRIYQAPPPRLVIEDDVLARRIHIASGGSRSTVVWNPWTDIAAQMADLGDDDYRRMLCVETANAAADAVTLAPGESHRLVADYRVVPY